MNKLNNTLPPIKYIPVLLPEPVMVKTDGDSEWREWGRNAPPQDNFDLMDEMVALAEVAKGPAV